MRKKLLLALAVTSAMVAGCADKEIDQAKKHADKEIDQAKQQIESQLKDPQSAQYKQVTKFSENVVCGLVNAKNSMGGYVGFKPFVFNGPEVGDVVLDASSYNITIFCNNEPKKKLTVARLKYEESARLVKYFEDKKPKEELVACIMARDRECIEFGNSLVSAQKDALESKNRMALIEASYK